VKTFPNKITSSFKPRYKNESKLIQILKLWSANHFHKMGYKIQFNYSIQRWFFASIMATRVGIGQCIECTTFFFPGSLLYTLSKILRQGRKFEVTLVVPEIIYLLDAEEHKKDAQRIKHLPQILEDYDIKLLTAPYHFLSDERWRIPFGLVPIQ